PAGQAYQRGEGGGRRVAGEAAEERKKQESRQRDDTTRRHHKDHTIIEIELPQVKSKQPGETHRLSAWEQALGSPSFPTRSGNSDLVDDDLVPNPRHMEKLFHVGVSHADTAMGSGTAELVFYERAVERVAVADVQTVVP